MMNNGEPILATKDLRMYYPVKGGIFRRAVIKSMFSLTLPWF